MATGSIGRGLSRTSYKSLASGFTGWLRRCALTGNAKIHATLDWILALKSRHPTADEEEAARNALTL